MTYVYLNMQKLFDNSDSEADDVDLKTNNTYASNYNAWRQKEELNKLKTKYGEGALGLDDENSASSSSDADDDEEEIPQELEKEFFKTLSSLKNKDPKIYDESFQFFKNPIDKVSKSTRKKDTAMYVKDYERKMLLENDVDEQEDNINEPQTTYVEEQNQLKQTLKNALQSINSKDEENDGDWGGLFKVRQKTKSEQKKEEDDYREWLAGHKKEIDKNTESDLKPLRDYWNDPELGEREKFLKDYVLNKRFLDKENENYVPTYEEIIHDSDDGFSEDEAAIEKQEEFEYKYNYRFEEPDQEFIKRYPRSMESSVRKQDDRRKVKRAETKQRKLEEKRQKMEELKQMQTLKHKEIEEKIMKLKEITGNTDVQFKSEDIEEDFDPATHDRRMQILFNDEFYEGVEGEQKPEFPELDEELEIENWDNFEAEENEPHCEDEDFNMDCDYNPEQILKSQDKVKERRKRKRKSKFAEAVGEVKPVFNPQDKTYQEYLDEYYKLDCEDIIGDVPCRFKYRQVIPNDFGLSIEEILLAKDKELNRWCSIKKAIQYRPQKVEKYDVVAFSKKAQNEPLKRKMLPSLFLSEESSTTKGNEDKVTSTQEEKKRKKLNDIVAEENAASKSNKKNRKNLQGETSHENTTQNEEENFETNTSQSTLKNLEINSQSVIENKLSKKKHRNIADKIKDKKKKILPPLTAIEAEEHQADEHFENLREEKSELAPTLKLNKKKRKKRESSLHNKEEESGTNTGTDLNWNVSLNNEDKNTSGLNGNERKKQKKVGSSKDANSEVSKANKDAKRKRIKQKNERNKKIEDTPVKISDARLTAYGFKPKKFKNKIKYGKKNRFNKK